MNDLSRRDFLKAGATAVAPAVLGVGLGANRAVAADPYSDAVLVDGEPPRPPEGSFTIAVLPDTQLYSEKYPELFAAQTQWIVEQREARNIVFAMHLGDLTNHNTPEQWEHAAAAMHALDGKVPYAIVPGNHDLGPGGTGKDRTTLINDYFPVSDFRKQPTFGGTFDEEPDRIENSYHTLDVGDRKFLILALEFGPREEIVRWANDVAARHADREAILLTHAYMYFDDTRYDWNKYGPKQHWNPHNYGVGQSKGGDVHDGEELWQELVSRHENFILTLNGHVLNDGLGRLSSETPGGNVVHQMLVNFQMRPNGGDGWLRLLEFDAAGKTVQTYDYSPTRDQRNESPENQFELKLS